MTEQNVAIDNVVRVIKNELCFVEMLGSRNKTVLHARYSDMFMPLHRALEVTHQEFRKNRGIKAGRVDLINNSQDSVTDLLYSLRLAVDAPDNFVGALAILRAMGNIKYILDNYDMPKVTVGEFDMVVALGSLGIALRTTNDDYYSQVRMSYIDKKSVLLEPNEKFAIKRILGIS